MSFPSFQIHVFDAVEVVNRPPDPRLKPGFVTLSQLLLYIGFGRRNSFMELELIPVWEINTRLNLTDALFAVYVSKVLARAIRDVAMEHRRSAVAGIVPIETLLHGFTSASFQICCVKRR
jgi:hypothetical protein